jgi:hypothetical protein
VPGRLGCRAGRRGRRRHRAPSPATVRRRARPTRVRRRHRAQRARRGPAVTTAGTARSSTPLRPSVPPGDEDVQTGRQRVGPPSRRRSPGRPREAPWRATGSVPSRSHTEPSRTLDQERGPCGARS